MSQLHLVFLYVFILLGRVAAQPTYQSGARSISLGEASLLMSDVWATQNNPSMLSSLKNFQAGIWAERKFNIRGLSNGAIAICNPLGKDVAAGVILNTYGSTTFRQMYSGVSVGMKLAPNLDGGVGIGLLSSSFQQKIYGKHINGIANLGASYKLNPNSIIGFNISNPTGEKLTDSLIERIPTIIQFGVKQKAGKMVNLLAELEKVSDQKLNYKAALEYTPGAKLKLRIGLKTWPMSYGFGMGYKTGNIQLNLSFQVHEVLGISPSADLIFDSPKK